MWDQSHTNYYARLDDVGYKYTLLQHNEASLLYNTDYNIYIFKSHNML